MKIRLLGFILLASFFMSTNSFAQVNFSQLKIKLQKEGDVLKAPCVINGLKLKFALDTTSNNVSISLSSANLLFENGYLKAEDLGGDSVITENTKLVFREFRMGSLKITNMAARVVTDLKTPIMIGHSAIKGLGRMHIVGNEIVALNVASKFTQADIDKIIRQAKASNNEKMFVAAADILQKLYDQKVLEESGIYSLADCYFNAQNYTKALQYYSEVYNKPEIDKWNLYISLAKCYLNLNEFDKAEQFAKKSEQYATSDFKKFNYYETLGNVYYGKKQCSQASENFDLALDFYLKDNNNTTADITSGNIKNDQVIRYFYLFANKLINCGFQKEGNSLMQISAKYGLDAAIFYCDLCELDYKKLPFVPKYKLF